MHLYHVCTNGMERLYFLVRTLLSHERRVRDMSSTGLREEHPPMGQITALFGETLAELDKDVFARMVEDGRSVKALKRVLATETGFSRFQQNAPSRWSWPDMPLVFRGDWGT